MELIEAIVERCSVNGMPTSRLDRFVSRRSIINYSIITFYSELNFMYQKFYYKAWGDFVMSLLQVL